MQHFSAAWGFFHFIGNLLALRSSLGATEQHLCGNSLTCDVFSGLERLLPLFYVIGNDAI